MGVNKVVINNEVKLDLTADTVTPETLLSGVTAHNAAGELIVGELDVSGGGGAVSYSVEPKTETWQHNSYVTISVDIGADGSVSAYKSSGGGTANNMVICYPQSDTWSAASEITRIPFPHEEGEHTIPVTIWWDNQNGAHQDSNNHTLTYRVVTSSSGGGGDSGGGSSIDVQPLSVTENGTYTAPEGVAYSPVTVNVSVAVSSFYTGSGTPAASLGSVGDFFFVTG